MQSLISYSFEKIYRLELWSIYITNYSEEVWYKLHFKFNFSAP